jgi:hypothetical protein
MASSIVMIAHKSGGPLQDILKPYINEDGESIQIGNRFIFIF